MYARKIEELKNQIESSESEFSNEDIDLLEKLLDSFFEYIEAIQNGEAAIQSARFRFESYEADKLKDVVMRFDRLRTAAHNAAMDSIQIINRLCQVYDAEMIFESIEDMNRTEIANKIIKPFVDEIREVA